MTRKIGLLIVDNYEITGYEGGFGEYYEEQFNKADDTLNYEVIHCVTGDLLPNVSDFPSYKGFVISGSPYSVNDSYQWIRNLEKFIVEIDNYNNINESKPIKLFGICYGHQLIAKAFGGVVTPVKSLKKFIFGSDKVDLDDRFCSLQWYKDLYGTDQRNFRIMKAHGEEVSTYPSNAVNVGRSENCPHEAAIYGDHIASFQGHPEFTIALMCNEIGPSVHRQGIITEDMLEHGRKTSKLADTNLLKLVVNFLKTL